MRRYIEIGNWQEKEDAVYIAWTLEEIKGQDFCGLTLAAKANDINLVRYIRSVVC